MLLRSTTAVLHITLGFMPIGVWHEGDSDMAGGGGGGVQKILRFCQLETRELKSNPV